MPTIPQVQVGSVHAKIAPLLIHYSSAPRVGTDLDGRSYVIKGPQAEIVVPEALCTHLLRTVELPGVRVPDFAAVQITGEPAGNLHFGSVHLQTVSPIDPHLPRHREEAAAIVAVDIWLCNKDRNIGNFLLEYIAETGPTLVAIDFGAAVAAKHGGFLECAMVKSREMWPQNQAAKALGKLPWPEATIKAIESIDESTIRAVAVEVAAAFPCFTWLESAVTLLKTRASQVRQSAKQVWHDCNR